MKYWQIAVLSSLGSFAKLGREASCISAVFTAVTAVSSRLCHVITECIGSIPKPNTRNISVTLPRGRKLRHATGLVQFFHARECNTSVVRIKLTNAPIVAQGGESRQKERRVELFGLQTRQPLQCCVDVLSIVFCLLCLW